MRSVVWYIGQKWRKFSTKFMKSFDKDNKWKGIIYKDANNFYGWSYFLAARFE